MSEQSSSDQLKKFLLDDRSARVSAVEMEHVWHEATHRHQYPLAVQELLGELMCAAALLASNLKFEGALLLQLQGNGPIRLIVVECRSDMSMRATVKLGSGEIGVQTGLGALINPDGDGRFSVILNPPKDAPNLHPYQGIVSLESESVGKAIEQYMQQSEQLSTRLWLSVTPERISGLMLQKLPVTGGTSGTSQDQADSSWEHARMVCETVTSSEMASVPTDTLLERLFWERPVFNLESRTVHWHCGCTRDRVASMLQSLGQSEVQDIVQNEGQVEVTCEFCGEKYAFNQQDATNIFLDPDNPLDSTTTLH
ncbi:Hsp33 family molecular chaperone HslO [Orrella marina]|uniref:Redox-regulated molecular chaperone Hsp33 n=1 Tax=Orrella marina TaxID=2163011 RepID=A0A2R4XIX1_9BURK|nr:Hsp33 family molecular chaperone HslO [Orrella marina]AWB33750.1 redox-regulated molecular chaperone Hsp33 [Orrella marina]